MYIYKSCQMTRLSFSLQHFTIYDSWRKNDKENIEWNYILRPFRIGMLLHL